jgi:acetyl-CoA carboxylase carboxyl transferase subunit beta
MLGDVHLAEPGAVIGFAGARVIEQTIREKLPSGFQRAEYLLAHGMVDQVVHRFKLRETIARILDLLMRPDRASQAVVVASKAAAEPLADRVRQEISPRESPTPAAERRQEMAPAVAGASDAAQAPTETAEHGEQPRP